MGTKTLGKFKLIGLDTNIFIYHLHQNPQFTSFTDTIFNTLAENKITAVTSLITLIELLSFNAPSSKLKELEENFKTTPNLTILDVDHKIAIEAARIRREEGFRLPDAIQLATAMQSKTQAFVTNDQKLKNFKKLQIILIQDLTAKS